MVSVERIYQHIRLDKERGGELWKHCRFRLKHRKRPVSRHMPLCDRVGIEERPAEADGRRFGDWEKGLIEYTNRLFRQYIPKGVSFKDFTEEQVKLIQYKINARPRKKLGFRSPVQLFYRYLNT